MNILNKIRQGFVFFDGGTGTLLQSMGLKPGELPEEGNLSHPEKIRSTHRSYLEAGCQILKTNTFGANRLKFGDRLEEVIQAAFDCARGALEEVPGSEERYLALDMGPLGKMLRPFGDLAFEDAVSQFAQVVRIGAQCGADLILIETMNDAYETKAAVLAAKENSSLPVFVTNVYDER